MKIGEMKMDVLTKSIRKLMGWCPNSKICETQNFVHPKHFEASNQSRGKNAGNSPASPISWWNKRHNKQLILSSLTIFSLCWIGFQGISFRDKTFIAGLIIGIIFNLLFCIWDLHSLDKAKNSTKKISLYSMSTKMRVIISVLSLILLYLYFPQFGWKPILIFISAFCLVALVYYFKLDSIYSLILLLSLGSTNGFGYMLTFLSGYCLTVFLYYVATIYWEKKNNKIVLVYRRKTSVIYIVNAGAEL